MNQLLWLRSDLRVADNTALAAAMDAGPTVALYLVTPAQWLAHDDAACKVDFRLRNLSALSARLAELNVPLLIRRVEDWQAVPGQIAELCQQHRIGVVHINEEYGVNEQRRDEATAYALRSTGASLRRHCDQLLFAPDSVKTLAGGCFKVFSQFRKVCYSRLSHSLPRCIPVPAPQPWIPVARDPVPTTAARSRAPTMPCVRTGRRAKTPRTNAWHRLPSIAWLTTSSVATCPPSLAPAGSPLTWRPACCHLASACTPRWH